MNSIQGFGSSQGVLGMMSSSRQQPAELTDDQKTQIQTILSKYDSKNITAADAQDIFKQFQEAGITPSKGMKEAIEAAGFDAEQLRTLGMQQNGSTSGTTGTQQSQTLTADQKSQVEDILADYDSDTLTAEQAKEIFKKFQDAGITPGEDLRNTVAATGFDSEKLGALAMPKGGMPPQNFGTSQGVNTSALESLQSILSQYDLTQELSSEDQKTLISKLSSAGLLNSGGILNISA